MTPKATIIMPVYNSAPYLDAAIGSALRQTFRDFILLIIDDGSTDSSSNIIDRYASIDERIRILHNDRNMGLVYTRNHGIAEAATEYIALLDSDDIAAPKRLEKQIAFLDSHQDYALVGSFVRQITAAGTRNGVKWKNSAPAEAIPGLLLFHNYFTQSAVTLRKSMLPPVVYRPGFAPAEDYDLWVRLAGQHKTCNLPVFLTDYRVHASGASVVGKDKKNAAINEIAAEQLGRLGLKPTPDQLKLHRSNFTSAADAEDFLRRRQDWLQLLIDSNEAKGIYPAAAFNRTVREMWLNNCRANAESGLAAWQAYWKSDLSDWRFSDKLVKLSLQCLRGELRRRLLQRP